MSPNTAGASALVAVAVGLSGIGVSTPAVLSPAFRVNVNPSTAFGQLLNAFVTSKCAVVLLYVLSKFPISYTGLSDSLEVEGVTGVNLLVELPFEISNVILPSSSLSDATTCTYIGSASYATPFAGGRTISLIT